MTDRAVEIAELLLSGELCPPGTRPETWTTAILQRFPGTDLDVISRAFEIALEVGLADDSMRDSI